MSNEIKSEELRALVRGRVGDGKGSLADVARLSGVGYSTLSAWMSGKYAGDNARVEQQVTVWLDSLAPRASMAGTFKMPEYVATPTAQKILSVFTHAQYLPDLVVVTGGAGIGKTTAIRQYAASNPNVWVLTGEPSVASAHAVLDYLCETFGINESLTSRRSRAIGRKLSGSGGLVIIDEAQHLKTQALDQLRTLHDKSNVGMALVGNEQVYSRLDGGGRRAQFAQLFSRVGMRLIRPKPSAADIEALLTAAGVEGDKERRLLRAVGQRAGALRGVAKTLRVAHTLAEADGLAVPEVGHLTLAWNRLSDSATLGEAA